LVRVGRQIGRGEAGQGNNREQGTTEHAAYYDTTI
jgi:hypothetical protein